MKLKITALFTAFALAALNLSGPAQAAGKLSIYNWFDYMPQDFWISFRKSMTSTSPWTHTIPMKPCWRG